MDNDKLQEILNNHEMWLEDNKNGKRANLRYANLRYADLSDADLSDAMLPTYIITPDEGNFVGWKKVIDVNDNNYILKLRIIGDRLNSLVGRKCRCSESETLCAYDMDDTEIEDKSKIFYSKYDSNFIYQVGKANKVDDFNSDIRIECAEGIHFFITKEEAKDY